MNKGGKQNAGGADHEPDSGARRWALASLALAMLLPSLGISIANVALPTFAEAFAAPFQSVQWVVIAYLLAITVMIVSAGRLGDILGHRRVLLAGLALFAAASLACGLAPSLAVLVAARAAQGLGAAILMALSVALVRETVPADRIGSAMGLLGTMSAVGTALGPSLGGVLLSGPGWRAVFLVIAPLGLLGLLLTHRVLPARNPAVASGRQDFDGLGTLLLGLTLAAYALAMTVGRGHFDRANLLLLLAAGLGAGLFVAAQRHAAAPLIRLSAFRDRALSASLVMNALVATVMMTTFVVGPFYLSVALGLGAAGVGMVMSVGPALAALSGVPAGRLVDRLGAPRIVVAGLVAMAAGTAALSSLPALFGVAGYIAAIALLTPGYQLFLAANNTAVMMDAGPDRRGVVSGLLNLSRNLGFVTGASAMGAVFAAATGTSEIATAAPAAVSLGMRVAFAVATGLIVVALAAAFAGRAGARRETPSGR